MKNFIRNSLVYRSFSAEPQSALLANTGGFVAVFLTVLLAICPVAYAADNHDHEEHKAHPDKIIEAVDEHGHDHKHEEEKQPLELTAELAQQLGLTTAIGQSGALHQQIKLYGQVSALPEQVRNLSARFPGVITSVKVGMGSRVNKGDLLAIVEANESLRSYSITAPIAGVVIARNANEGEATNDNVLFTLANHQQLMVTIAVFPEDAVHVRAGQNVLLKNKRLGAQTVIDSLTPASDNAPYLHARVLIDNQHAQWTPGEWVNAYITLSEATVALRVDNRALQQLDDEWVVFVQDGNHYEARPIQLGRADNQFTEVLTGLNTGEYYVVENSYLLKADSEKSDAAHDH